MRHRKWLDQRQLLVNHADAVADTVGRRFQAHRPPSDINLSFRQGIKARKAVGNDGFAGTIFSEQGVDFTGPDIDIDVIQDQMLPHTGKPLAQARAFKQFLAVVL